MIKNLVSSCAECGQDHLDIQNIELFYREDSSDIGVHYTINSKTLNFDADISSNPAPRCSGMKINFLCQLCKSVGHINIYDHKGEILYECK